MSAWFVYKKVHHFNQPQILFMPPTDGSGKVNWEGFIQKHRISDSEAMLGIVKLCRAYPLRVRVKAPSVRYNMENYPL